jgi:hypothetical protein
MWAAVSDDGLRALWSGAPWTMRVYVALGAIAQVLCAISYRTPYTAVSVLILLAVSYLLLKGWRWAWLAMVVLTVAYLIVFLLAWWVVPALCYLAYLTLLLAPPSRRHFSRERPGQPGSGGESMVDRFRASPAALKAFAAILFALYVGRLFFDPAVALYDKPVRAALTIAIFAALGFFVAQGARVAWSLAIALMMAVVAAMIGRGHWSVVAVPVALLLLLLLPGSVAFVWRDRQRSATQG